MVAHLQQAVLAEACALHVRLESQLLGDTRESDGRVIVFPCNSKKSKVRTARRVKRLGKSSLGMCQVYATKGTRVSVWTFARGNVEIEEPRQEQEQEEEQGTRNSIVSRHAVCLLLCLVLLAVWLQSAHPGQQLVLRRPWTLPRPAMAPQSKPSAKKPLSKGR